MRNNDPRSGTATLALAAALPGLALATVAAVRSTSLVLAVDCLLSLLDATALVAVWCAARAGAEAPAREARARRLTAAAMLAAMAAVSASALARLAAGPALPAGDGVALGLGLNVVQGCVNLALLLSWRRVRTAGASRLARDQVCLFADKLGSNLVIAGSLTAAFACPTADWAPHLDPIASLLMAAISACCIAPVLLPRLDRDGARQQEPVDCCDAVTD